MKRFRDWGMRSKILSLFLATVALVLIGLLGYFIPVVGNSLMEEKRVATKSVVEVAYGVIDYWAGQAASGAVTKEEAEKRAKDEIRGFRYKGSEYFWINDMNHVVVMHGAKASLEGKDVSGLKDEDGVYLFREMVTVSKKHGQGFVNYRWPKAGSDQPVPKISFVKLYKPWGWIVGSGIYVDDVESQVMSLRLQILIPTIIGIALLIAVVIFVVRGLVLPLQQALIVSNAMAEGDLTHDIEVKSQDEVGLLTQAMSDMLTALRRVVGEVATATEQVAAGSEELASSATILSEGATEQASSVEEVSASMEEMTSSIEQNASNAKITDDMTNKAATDTERGGDAVAKTVEAMKQIAEKISIIEDIARQTNLLALNAAIEAARAGEHGKGFAVVAAEVRKLAERSGTAAAEISELSVSSVEVAEQAGELLGQIVPDIQKTAELVQEIAAASNQQRNGGDQVNSAVHEMDKVIQQNASASEEVASTAEELAGQAQQLQESMRFFQVGGYGGNTMMRQPPAPKKTTVVNRPAQPLPSAAPAPSKGNGVDLGMDDDDTGFERF
ncbi:methyl-accepting chemotaxis protein [Pseudodesulfovibrio sp. zrk46]|uniref:methyl-accepting chemotaxis protein n=1 Tax=Pseudodesulfovibrio sp. zrk46 TaxID=2725288 RepID=UPI0014499850|nr:methyl-accepting chemotaxis protein [Pseudodesulfovibrio sp. zrk46]QJB55023.1 methyl-accepting chemotaxis protein [Pseudodesulfovibrio sp. zrk46]